LNFNKRYGQTVINVPNRFARDKPAPSLKVKYNFPKTAPYGKTAAMLKTELNPIKKAGTMSGLCIMSQ